MSPPLELSYNYINDSGSHLFRLPYELRHRIYQYVLTPAHIHIERRVDYKLTDQGIKIVIPKPREPPAVLAAQSQQSAEQKAVNDSQDLPTSGDFGEDFHEGAYVEDDSDDESEGPEVTEDTSNAWDCSKLYLDSESPDFLTISETGDWTSEKVRSKLFRIYYCRSQKLGGPSAVPPGYLDHEQCAHDAEQTDFEGSTIASFRATCQWAYCETLSVAAYKSPQVVVFAPFLSRNSSRLELASHTLHFSDTKDLACFTGLVPSALSESFHSLSIHIQSLHNDYWPYLCSIYLQPWSRLSLSDWLFDPEDRSAEVTFYHNHTTHDLADSSHGDYMGRQETEEALASTWVVPNISLRSRKQNWSTKFRMSALQRRAGYPLDLRLSFPIFLRTEEPRFRHCLDKRNYWADSVRHRDCRAAPIPHEYQDHYRPDWFDSRRWLSERIGDQPVTNEERHQTARLTWHGDQTRDNTPAKTQLPEARWVPEPGDPDSVSEMERELCFPHWEMQQFVKQRIWLDTHKDCEDSDEFITRRAAYDRSFRDLFLRQKRDTPGQQGILTHVNQKLKPLDNCQGMESLEIDFFGDAQSPGIVKEFSSVGTAVFRGGLVERFTGRGWIPSGMIDSDPISTFWDIGPHPEPDFRCWADPDNNMAGMNMDDNWRC